MAQGTLSRITNKHADLSTAFKSIKKSLNK